MLCAIIEGSTQFLSFITITDGRSTFKFFICLHQAEKAKSEQGEASSSDWSGIRCIRILFIYMYGFNLIVNGVIIVRAIIR